jgi:hypothetical protein
LKNFIRFLCSVTVILVFDRSFSLTHFWNIFSVRNIRRKLKCTKQCSKRENTVQKLNIVTLETFRISKTKNPKHTSSVYRIIIVISQTSFIFLFHKITTPVIYFCHNSMIVRRKGETRRLFQNSRKTKFKRSSIQIIVTIPFPISVTTDNLNI